MTFRLEGHPSWGRRKEKLVQSNTTTNTRHAYPTCKEWGRKYRKEESKDLRRTSRVLAITEALDNLDD